MSVSASNRNRFVPESSHLLDQRLAPSSISAGGLGFAASSGSSLLLKRNLAPRFEPISAGQTVGAGRREVVVAVQRQSRAAFQSYVDEYVKVSGLFVQNSNAAALRSGVASALNKLEDNLNKIITTSEFIRDNLRTAITRVLGSRQSPINDSLRGQILGANGPVENLIGGKINLDQYTTQSVKLVNTASRTIDIAIRDIGLGRRSALN